MARFVAAVLEGKSQGVRAALLNIKRHKYLFNSVKINAEIA